MIGAAGLAVGSLVLASGGPWGDDGWDGGWLLARLAFTVLWIVLVFTIVRFVIFGRFGRRGRGPWGPSPMERARGVLAERYARGEIDAEEYRARSETLKD
jgi:putative membrane protein